MTKKFLKDFMRKKSVLPTILMVALVGLVSCGPDDDPDAVSVSMPSVTLSATGGSQSIQVTSNTKWTVSGAPGWLVVSPMQGSNNGAFTITAEANKDKASRNCTLMINAGSASAVLFSSPAPAEPAEQSVPDPGHHGCRDDPRGCPGIQSRQSLPDVFRSAAVVSESALFRRVYCQVPGVFPADDRTAETGPCRILAQKVPDVSGFLGQ